MWGPVGLVLATPITVCMVVMGRHIPRLGFLSVLLSDEEALTPAEDCYHRLLRVGDHDEMDLVDQYLRTHTLVELYDQVLLPAMVAAESDHRAGLLEEDQRRFVAEGLRDILDELAPSAAVAQGPGVAGEDAPRRPAPRVFLLPTRAERDEVAAAMLAQVLGSEEFDPHVGSSRLALTQKAEAVIEARPEIICISSVAPSSIRRVRFICLRIRERLPAAKIIVGFWGEPEKLVEAAELITEAGATAVVASFADAQEALRTLASPRQDATR
jgi:hypothetical protein